jgi:hypothetical protein
MEDPLAHAGENYNTTIPIHNSLGGAREKEMLKNFIHRENAIYEEHLKKGARRRACPGAAGHTTLG